MTAVSSIEGSTRRQTASVECPSLEPSVSFPRCYRASTFTRFPSWCLYCIRFLRPAYWKEEKVPSIQIPSGPFKKDLVYLKKCSLSSCGKKPKKKKKNFLRRWMSDMHNQANRENRSASYILKRPKNPSLISHHAFQERSDMHTRSLPAPVGSDAKHRRMVRIMRLIWRGRKKKRIDLLIRAYRSSA